MISKFLVVTAAHCVEGPDDIERKKPEDSTFYIGKNNIESLISEGHYVTSTAKHLLLHPLWKRSKKKFDNDVAVAVLLREVTFNQLVKPICLWRNSQSFEDMIGRKGIVAGWGKTELSSISKAHAIYAEIPVVSHSTCLFSDASFRSILSENSFCAGVDKSDIGSCSGDSGKSMIIK